MIAYMTHVVDEIIGSPSTKHFIVHYSTISYSEIITVVSRGESKN